MSFEFVSYPKCGRSWVRFILHRVGAAGPITFQHDGFEFNDRLRPPHDYSVARRLERYKTSDKVVFLSREPRDVLVSLYHQVTGRFSDIFSYPGTISDFIRDDYFGAAPLKKFNDMWQSVVSERPYLMLSYEDCHSDMELTVRRLLEYYGVHVDDDRISEAVAAGSYENMKSTEDSDRFSEPWLRRRNGSPKVRAGRIGAFREELLPADISYLDDVFGAE